MIEYTDQNHYRGNDGHDIKKNQESVAFGSEGLQCRIRYHIKTDDQKILPFEVFEIHISIITEGSVMLNRRLFFNAQNSRIVNPKTGSNFTLNLG